MRPKITETDIRGLVSQKILWRGEDYYREGCIQYPKRQGKKIWAMCYGSQIYHLSLNLEDHSITEAHCDCPYDWGEYCKHQIALLLTYVHKPDAFQEIAPISELLADYDRHDLVKLIQKLVDAEPQLLDRVQLTPAQKDQPEIDTKMFFLQAKQAIQPDTVARVLHRLQPLLDFAVSFMDVGDYVQAGMLYCSLLDAFDSQYDDVMLDVDYNGEIVCVVNDCVEALGECLLLGKHKISSGDRQKWLEQLLQTFLKDIDLGGIDYGADADQYLKRCATEAEWTEIEAHCLQLLDHVRDWQRSEIVDFLGDRLSSAAKVKFAQEHGTPLQQIWAYVDIQDYQTAQELALTNLTYEIVPIQKLADAFVAAGEDQLALAMITEFQQRQKHPGPSVHYFSWLAKYYEQHEDLNQAIHYGKEVVLTSGRFEDYQFVKQIMQRAGNWAKLRPLFHKELEQKGLLGLLTEIALEEKDLDQTLSWLAKENTNKGYFYNKVQQTEKAAQLAREQQLFTVAITLYRDLAEQSIAQRSRKHYQVAARYLKEIKYVFQADKNAEDWQQYFGAFRAEYHRLPALMDECQQAMLP